MGPWESSAVGGSVKTHAVASQFTLHLLDQPRYSKIGSTHSRPRADEATKKRVCSSSQPALGAGKSGVSCATEVGGFVEMVEIIPLDPDQHLQRILELTEEYLSWIAGEVLLRYGIDAEEAAGMTVQEFAQVLLNDLSPYVPPDGLFCVVTEHGTPVGMGALAKLEKGVGTIRRMYVPPEYRGRGYGEMLLAQLMTAAKERGCRVVLLETGQFMEAAQHMYRAAGFVERARYPEVETPPQLQPYWFCMEKHL